jgi:uncharacterized protein (DUF433 family)
VRRRGKSMDNTLVQHIEATPGVMGGKARIAGHRIRVMDIVVWHEGRGMSPDEIVDHYPGITLADVYSALAYYFDHRDEIEAEFEREAKLVAAAKMQHVSRLQAKLNG